MIKRLLCVTRRAGLSPERFADGWPEVVADAASAPESVRPVRLAACTAMPELLASPVKHDGVGLSWFTDLEHLRRFDAWLADDRQRPLRARLDSLTDRDATRVLVAEEAIARGADWLARRWDEQGTKFKHMAFAVRAAGLSPSEFSARWRAHAGRYRRPGEARATAIPEDVRGRAYVQNHPIAGCNDGCNDGCYDAVNEVWFDDVSGLRTRIEWFEANGDRGDELFGASWLLAMREHAVRL